MRSFFLQIFSLISIAAALLPDISDGGVDFKNGNMIQSLMDSTDILDSSTSGFDNIKGSTDSWGEVKNAGTEQAQSNNDNRCSGSKPIKKRRRDQTYCSPGAAHSLQPRPPSSQQEAPKPGSQKKKSGQGQTYPPPPGNIYDIFAPWSPSPDPCVEGKPVLVCAAAGIGPNQGNRGWTLSQWPFCRLCA